ncbi:BlaI/MecI/CopY family transcriptional regulator [Sphingomonas piscis]|uniref:BlaI/MecI/CopY family transcriptional regulator n=1 Tax=Sphingomonas piscis TaxID=2714943 RepID=A0A6G7YMY4_9SPHN|nr:BlaI/MecI/CopY family transcriptional regulator [Sphingomonas piscis]QIK78103.1 BlaI/MecI/CopY family transcriptional regulator [Sphingomonas piscis]
MSEQEIKVSDAELQLMQALWDDSPMTASDLAQQVGSRLGWSLTTVKTLLARLAAKGAVATQADGRRFLYRPAVERDVIAARQATGLVDRLFGGRVSPLVAQLAEQRDLDPKDLDELEELVRSLRK